MDSPDFIRPQFHQDMSMSLKKSSTEDSGYMTVATPTSGESIGFNSEYSSNIFDLTNQDKNHAGPSQLSSTPFNYETISFINTPNDVMSSTRICPSSALGGRNILQRSDAFEDMECSPCEPSYSPRQDNRDFNSHLSAETEHSHSISSLSISDNSKSLLETPKKNKIYNLKSQRPMKRTSTVQKLGTPEKNKLLYCNLLQVAPRKSPEKLLSPKKDKLHRINKFNSLYKEKIDYNGIEKVDFLRLLRRYGCVKDILKYLSGEDLLKVRLVSHSWHDALNECGIFKNRVLEFANSKRKNKENIPIETDTSKHHKKLFCQRSTSTELSVQKNLLNIQHSNQNRQKSPPVSPGKRKHMNFVRVASQDGTFELRSCSRCSKPAKLNGVWAECTGLSCGYVYCSKCLNEKNLCQSSCPNAVKRSSPNKDSPIKSNASIKHKKRVIRRLQLK